MGKVVLYIATSLDGFIAGPKGELEWLHAIPMPEQGDYGYSALISSIHATIMGRKTYDLVMSFGVEWPYPGLISYIATTDKNFKVSSPETFTIQKDLLSFVHELKASSEKDIWLIGGGNLITYFLNHDLLDRMILTMIPTIIGEGLPLFPDKPKVSQWKLVATEQFNTGVVNLTYDTK
jgi:dihydrofolate reductase